MAFLMAVLTGVVIFVVCVTCKVMASERGSETRIRITLAVGAAIIVVIWIWFFNWSSSPDRAKEQVAQDCENTTMAYVMSQNFVKQRLKAPTTAEFPAVTDSGV